MLKRTAGKAHRDSKAKKKKTTFADSPSTRSELQVPPLGATRQTLCASHSKLCGWGRPPPTIAAPPEDYIWGRRLPGAGAEGVQAVEGVIAAVSRGGQGVAALGIPAVDVTAVSDTPLRTLDVISLLPRNET